ncbi:NYN domain-containing protein [Rhabdothermincola sp.]|uniref:NYN domain-containing protein n=1 Tax=Rhabdothermincola sp. TaxID=2820405 RepID=UPI002FDFF794
MIRPHVVVDGSNIATEGRSTPSLRQLDEAVRAFMAEHPSDIVTVVVDATFGHRIDPSERAAFDDAVSSGELITAPAGAIGRGDAFILQIADKADATILSNDSFQEFHGQHEWLFDEGRLVGGKPVPGVGWVFLLRTPVRGPASRRAVKGAKDKAGKAKGKARDQQEREGKKDGRATKPSKGTETAKVAEKDEEKAAKRNRKKRSKPSEAINPVLPFIEFVARHPVGSVLDATVTRFSSHGAYVETEGVTCYVPLRLMGDPPPRSARDVLQIGETRTFAVHTIDAALRGVDLALVATRDRAGEPRREETSEETHESWIARARARETEGGTTKTNTGASFLATTFTADQHAEEAQVTPAKKAASKRAAKKTTAKRAAKKAPARKATKKAPAKKAAARKTTAKRTTKKATAKRTAKKATAKKATKKAPAKKATAKRTAKKAPARRR